MVKYFHLIYPLLSPGVYPTNEPIDAHQSIVQHGGRFLFDFLLTIMAIDTHHFLNSATSVANTTENGLG